MLTLRTEFIFLLRYLRHRPLAPALVFYCLLLVVLKTMGAGERAHAHDPSAWAGRVGAITGVVVQHPDARLSGCVYVLQTEAADFFDEPRQQSVLNGRLLLHVLKSTEPVAAPGDRFDVLVGCNDPPARGCPALSITTRTSKIKISAR